MRWYSIGESCLCWSFGDRLDAAVSAQVLSAYRRLRALIDRGEVDALDVVPSYTALAVYFDPATADAKRIRTSVEKVLAGSGADEAGEEGLAQGPAEVVLPVVYDGEDIERVARHNGLTSAEVVALHAGGGYTVAMIGFLPHFPYLIGLPEKLATPRLDSPRKRVPAGSVGIGGAQTGVYPRESPGGWNIIGRTDPALLAPLRPGDKVTFRET